MSRSSPRGAPDRRTFSAEFKAEAVHLMRARRAQGVSLTQIARDLDLRANLLWAWARQLDERGAERRESAAGRPRGESLDEEVRRLRREVVVLRQEREFAKKAAAFFAKESL